MNFGIIGVGGYIAPRHLEAIKALGHNLVVAYDCNDSVGIIDRYFPDCTFFTNFEKFLSFGEGKLDFVSVCTPNFLHASHIVAALRIGANVICEKPLVLTEQELDELAIVEKVTGKKVFTILQLRVHEAIQALKRKVEQSPDKFFDVKLTYITSRGDWYHKSWKGDVSKSGGLSTNIGVHFFDMLTWIFGDVREIELLQHSPLVEKGKLCLEKANVDWLLTIDRSFLPEEAKQKKITTYRSISIDGEPFEFSEGFTELHKNVYSEILDGKGFGLEDNRQAIRIVENLRASGRSQ